MARIILRSSVIDVNLNPAALARRIPDFGSMRERLASRTQHDLGVVDSYLEGRLIQVVGHVGDVYLREISAHIDHIVSIRDQLTRGVEAVVRGEGRIEGMSIGDLQRLFTELDAVLTELRSTERYVRELSEQRTRELFEGSSRRREEDADPIRSVDPTTPPPGAAGVLDASLTADATRSELGQQAQSVTFHDDGRVTIEFTNDTVELSVNADGLIEARVLRNGTERHRFAEFDTLRRHGSKPTSTRVMQSHHGLQDALMQTLFGDHGYNRNDPPTLWLRNSTSGSPHQLITHIQNHNQSTREADPNLSYARIRELGIADLRAAGCPDAKIREFMAAMDSYFESTILPQIPEADRPALVGSYQSLAGE